MDRVKYICIYKGVYKKRSTYIFSKSCSSSGYASTYPKKRRGVKKDNLHHGAFLVARLFHSLERLADHKSKGIRRLYKLN